MKISLEHSYIRHACTCVIGLLISISNNLTAALSNVEADPSITLSVTEEVEVNHDDDNKNEENDKNEGAGDYPDEDDVAGTVTFSVTADDREPGTVTVSVSASGMTFWKDSKKEEAFTDWSISSDEGDYASSESRLQTASATAYIEGTNYSGSLKDQVFTAQYSGEAENPPDDIIEKSTVYQVDLRVDSDNDGSNFSDDDDKIENSEKTLANGNLRSGVYIVSNTGDVDEDGILDYTDGFAYAGGSDDQIDSGDPKFVPIQVNFHTPIDLSTGKVTFNYTQADPTDASLRTGSGSVENPYVYSQPSGAAIRIWKQDAGVARNKNEVSASGDFVKSGTEYSISDFGSSRSVTLYVEGVGTGGVGTVDVSVDVGTGFNVSDVVRYTLLMVDLDIDSDYNDSISATDESTEMNAGGLVGLNQDDDDANNTVDKDQVGPITGENDLETIVLSLNPAATSGTLKLEATAGSGKIKVWKSSTKGNQVVLPKTWTIGSDNVPPNLYIEGIDESASVRDVELRLHYTVGNAEGEDTIKLTVVNPDLDIDSDYDGSITDTDDSIEMSAGGLVGLNQDDDDNDNTPDKDQSGTVGGENDLVEIKIELDPTMTSGELKLEAVAGGSKINIWDSQSKGTEVNLPKTWTLGTDTVPTSLYVEGIEKSASERDVQLRLRYNTESIEIDDEIKLTVVSPDLDIDSDYDGSITDTDDSIEMSAGGLVGLNQDDDDNDNTPDKDQSGTVGGEDNLVEIKIELDPTMTSGELKLEAVAGGSKINIWDSQTKGTEVNLPKTWTLGTDTVPTSLYVEGINASVSERDVELRLRYTSGSRDIDDTILLTVVEADLDEVIETNESANCTGYDVDEKALMVPMSGSNKIKVVIDGVSASGTLLQQIKFVSQPSGHLTITPVIPTSNTQELTLSGVSAALDVKIQMEVNGAKIDLFEADVLSRINRTMEIHAIIEENDDVQKVAVGDNAGSKKVCVASGPDGALNTVPSGDDQIDGTNIIAGLNGICDTAISADDIQSVAVGVNAGANSVCVASGPDGALSSTPGGDDQIIGGNITTGSDGICNTTAVADVQSVAVGVNLGINVVCVEAGVNGFRDTKPQGDDQIVGDNINAGADGICNTTASRVNIAPAGVPTAAQVEDFLNNKTWGNQANVHFTVTRTDHVVNYDLDRNKSLGDPLGYGQVPARPNELAAINSSSARNSGVDYNYYITDKVDVPIAITQYSPDIVMSQDSSTAPFLIIMAHEGGHLLRGVGGHTDGKTTYLMHTNIDTYGGCQIQREFWRHVNP